MKAVGDLEMKKLIGVWLMAATLTMGSATVVLADFLDWKRLAEQGDAAAQSILATMYVNGDGVAQDYKEAAKWYRKSAEQGWADAQGWLGAMYGNGQGVLHDKVVAHMWFNIAGANGSKIGADNRVRIEKQMTASQVRAAQQLARKCMKQHYKGCGS